MRVLQKKILILVISSILISAMMVMVIAFFNYNHIVENNSEQIMQLMCTEKRQIIDEKLLNIEHSVRKLYHFATNQIKETENLWRNERKYEEHISSMKELMEITAKYTDGAVSVYYRLDSAIKGPKQGVWMLQNASGEFVEYEMTDILYYDKDDIERVGWYYIPVANGKETWINPYYNKNMGKEIISYVIPIILDTQVIGVVGMDISTNLLYENAKKVKIYDTGYAFLMDHEGNFMYHPEMKRNIISEEFNHEHVYLYEKSLVSVEKQSVETYQWNNIDKKMTAQKLRNGMIFTVCVPEQEIKQPQRKVLSDSIAVIIFIMSVFVVATVSIIKVIVRLAYTDVMTRVGNKTAYTECVDSIYKRIRNKEKLNYLVVVMDINDLKKTNDTYGHEYGDKLIQNGADIAKKVWGSECMYRIGGDEFVA
ncbi:MAG: diguanylate cyclase, partial [Lachnospiraceae bacterium]|nr:diguanylate cyclase [Lachnospiraceae bacterium]